MNMYIFSLKRKLWWVRLGLWKRRRAGASEIEDGINAFQWGIYGGNISREAKQAQCFATKYWKYPCTSMGVILSLRWMSFTRQIHFFDVVFTGRGLAWSLICVMHYSWKPWLGSALSHWCIFHRKKAKEIVDTWASKFHAAPKEQRVPFLYLANDILQNSRRKGPEFVNAFWTVLPAVLRDVLDTGDETVRNPAYRLVRRTGVLVCCV
jgi:hypothetical protein